MTGTNDVRLTAAAATPRSNRAQEPEPVPADAGAASGRRGDGISTGRVRRSAPVASLVARTAGEAVVRAMRRKVTRSDASVDYERAVERYGEILGRSKGALMKAGQALSFMSLASSVPPEARAALARVLSRLREDAPAMPPEIARSVLEEDLGRAAETAFCEFEWEHPAAASIGQVHRARLHDGREVAVKVQYPGVAAAIDADLANNELLATFIAMLMSFWPRRIGTDLRSSAREVSAAVRAELDYVQEAVNQRAFADIYRGHPFIRVPEVIDELSTRRVLTQDFVEGLRWEDALDADEPLRALWAEAVQRFGPGTLYAFGICNVDPHPGNYRFHPDGTVSFLDFGCVHRLAPDTRTAMIRIMRAVLEEDPAALWAVCVEAGIWDAGAPVTPREAYAYWRAPFELLFDRQPSRLTPEQVSAAIDAQFSPAGSCANAVRHIHAPPGFTILVRQLLGGNSLVAELDVALPWRAIVEEFQYNRPPHNARAAEHWAFIEARHPHARHA